MPSEEDIKQRLTEKFNFPPDKVVVQRPRRVWIEVVAETSREVFEYAVKGLNFSQLCAITGLDEGQNLGVIYHLAQEGGTVLSIKTAVSKTDPVIKTVTDYFPSAENYERELADLFGFRIEGLPPGNRYPLTDDWPAGQFPLRKDWKKDVLQTGEH